MNDGIGITNGNKIIHLKCQQVSPEEWDERDLSENAIYHLIAWYEYRIRRAILE